MKKYTNALIATLLYVVSVIAFYWPGPVGNISPFWVSLLLCIAGLYAAYRSKKAKATGWFDYVLLAIGAVFLVIVFVYFAISAGA